VTATAWMQAPGGDSAPSWASWKFLFAKRPDGDALVNCWVESSQVVFASMTQVGRRGGTYRLGHCRVDCTQAVEVGWILVGVEVGRGMSRTARCPWGATGGHRSRGCSHIWC